MRPVTTAVNVHETWYKGDGFYGDGPDFHWDYYNSFVIQPMLLEPCPSANPCQRAFISDRTDVRRCPQMSGFCEAAELTRKPLKQMLLAAYGIPT
jgi:hypothetical protein